MNDLITAAQQALEALESCQDGDYTTGDVRQSFDEQAVNAAIVALWAALAQQAEPVEPVAWMYPDDYAGILKHQSRAEVFQKAWCNPAVCVPLYTTAPPQRKPLTEEEIRDLWSWSMTAEAERTATTQQHAFTRAVERAHGITDPQVADRLARHGIPMPGDPK